MTSLHTCMFRKNLTEVQLLHAQYFKTSINQLQSSQTEKRKKYSIDQGFSGGSGGEKEVEEKSRKGRQRRKRHTNRPKEYSSRTFCLT